MSAPERIWATWQEDFGAVQIGTWADTVRFEPLGVEYARADLPPTLAAALAVPEIAAMVESLEKAKTLFAGMATGGYPEMWPAYNDVTAALAALPADLAARLEQPLTVAANTSPCSGSPSGS